MLTAQDHVLSLLYRAATFVWLAGSVVGCGERFSQDHGKPPSHPPGGGDPCPLGPLSELEEADLGLALESTTGVRARVASEACTHSGIHCQPPTADQRLGVRSMFQSLSNELQRYPKSFVENYGPSQIWLVAELKSGDLDWEASGIALSGERVVYLNVNNACDPVGLKMVIHHEFFHVLDQQLFVNQFWDQAWNELNPESFKYVYDYKLAVGDMHPEDGFVTAYATTNAHEDRAETYAYSVVPEMRPWMDEWNKDDAYLKKKERSLHFWMRERWPEMTGFLNDATDASTPRTGLTLPPVFLQPR